MVLIRPRWREIVSSLVTDGILDSQSSKKPPRSTPLTILYRWGMLLSLKSCTHKERVHKLIKKETTGGELIKIVVNWSVAML